MGNAWMREAVCLIGSQSRPKQRPQSALNLRPPRYAIKLAYMADGRETTQLRGERLSWSTCTPEVKVQLKVQVETATQREWESLVRSSEWEVVKKKREREKFARLTNSAGQHGAWIQFGLLCGQILIIIVGSGRHNCCLTQKFVASALIYIYLYIYVYWERYIHRGG